MNDLRDSDDRAPVKRRAAEAFPFYVVCDVSNSMWRDDLDRPYTPWQVISDNLGQIVSAIQSNRTASAICHLSVIAFGERVETMLEMTDFRTPDVVLGVLPKLIYTDYEQVFTHLAKAIERDMFQLRRAHEPKSPAIYFLTDGYPQNAAGHMAENEWLPAVRAVQAMTDRPIVVSLGLGSAKETVLRQVASSPGPACIAETDADPSDLLRAILDSIIMSIQNTSQRGAFEFKVPAGMRVL